MCDREVTEGVAVETQTAEAPAAEASKKPRNRKPKIQEPQVMKLGEFDRNALDGLNVSAAYHLQLALMVAKAQSLVEELASATIQPESGQYRDAAESLSDARITLWTMAGVEAVGPTPELEREISVGLGDVPHGPRPALTPIPSRGVRLQHLAESISLLIGDAVDLEPRETDAPHYQRFCDIGNHLSDARRLAMELAAKVGPDAKAPAEFSRHGQCVRQGDLVDVQFRLPAEVVEKIRWCARDNGEDPVWWMIDSILAMVENAPDSPTDRYPTTGKDWRRKVRKAVGMA